MVYDMSGRVSVHLLSQLPLVPREQPSALSSDAVSTTLLTCYPVDFPQTKELTIHF